MHDRLIDDLLAEASGLDAFVAGLDDDCWERPTDFFGWTVRDQILHLFQVDRFGLVSRDMEGRNASSIPSGS